MIFTVRTTVGRESSVIESVARRAKNMGINIQSILHPDELRGYVFVEGELRDIENGISGAPHVRGIIKKEIPFESLRKFLEAKKVEIKVFRADIVEVTGGPFKNERGKVTRVDEAKEEVTIELLEAAIPIPITVSLDSIRLIESSQKPAEKSETDKEKGGAENG